MYLYNRGIYTCFVVKWMLIRAHSQKKCKWNILAIEKEPTASLL